MAAIYHIFNVVTEHFYIGSARNPKKRRWEHWNDLKKKQHHCVALQAAWDEYGPDAFEFVVLEEVEDETKLTAVEDTYLAQHAGTERCYNTAVSSMQPPSLQAGTIVKISATLTKRWATNPSLHPRLGTHHTEESKAKISASKKANPSRPWLGKERDEETRKKIGDAQRGKAKGARTYTPEGLARARENMRRHAHKAVQKGLDEVLAKFPEEVRTKYDFSAAVYTGALNRITGCKCPTHGEFSQYAAQFRKGRGCPQCGAEQRAESKRAEMKRTWASGEGREMFLASRTKSVDAPSPDSV